VAPTFLQVSKPMRDSWFVILGRGVFFIVGAGALVMALGGVTGGESITDPVFPAGLALGILAIAAAALTSADAGWQAVLVWLGIAAVVGGVAVFAGIILLDPDIGTNVYGPVLVPSVLILAAAADVALGRMRAGALGA
jgi:hypothetical protein